MTSARPWWLLPPGRIHPAWWLAFGALSVWVDHLAGFDADFPLLFTLPVIVAAWYSGRWPAAMLAAAVTAFRLVNYFTVEDTPSNLTSLVMTTVRGCVVLLIGLWFARLADHERELSRRVKILEGLLPICSFCKSIRNERGNWERLETFISRRSEAEFSHGVCPSCGVTHYPELAGQGESVATH
jgi:K+-sensing histidine kinase KdpD